MTLHSWASMSLSCKRDPLARPKNTLKIRILVIIFVPPPLWSSGFNCLGEPGNLIFHFKQTKVPKAAEHTWPVTGCETLGKSHWSDAYFSFLQDLSQSSAGLQRAVRLKSMQETRVLGLPLPGIGLDDLGLEVLCSNSSNIFLAKPSIQPLLQWRAILQFLKG